MSNSGRYEYTINLEHYQEIETPNVFTYSKGLKGSYLSFCKRAKCMPKRLINGRTLLVYAATRYKKIYGECLVTSNNFMQYAHTSMPVHNDRIGNVTEEQILLQLIHASCKEVQKRNSMTLKITCSSLDYIMHIAIEQFLQDTCCKCSFKMIKI